MSPFQGLLSFCFILITIISTLRVCFIELDSRTWVKKQSKRRSKEIPKGWNDDRNVWIITKTLKGWYKKAGRYSQIYLKVVFSVFVAGTPSECHSFSEWCTTPFKSRIYQPFSELISIPSPASKVKNYETPRADFGLNSHNAHRIPLPFFFK